MDVGDKGEHIHSYSYRWYDGVTRMVQEIQATDVHLAM